mgnify:FL=1
MTNRKKIPGKIGSTIIRKELGERIIDVTIEILADSYDERLDIVDEITNLLYTETDKELTLRNKKKYKASIDGNTDISNLYTDGEVTLTFIASNPLAISLDKIEVEDIHNKTIINQGTYKTTGTITTTISSNVSNLKITLQNTGEYIYLEDNFKTDDVVEINLEDEFVKKNGNLIMDRLHFESVFFDIPVGEFTITISSGIGDLTYYERWL